ncbi:MAG: hypothetical protein ACRCUB_19170, partial [Plesiomonas shigelloides]
LSISKWGEAEETAKAVRFVLDIGVLKTYSGISRLAQEAEAFAAKCHLAIGQLPDEKQDQIASLIKLMD